MRRVQLRRARSAPAPWIALVAAAIITLAVPERVRAQVLVELFTSQGCSSCPPADELLAELSQRPDVVALSLHVDYWDYLGWPDVFASPAFSRRQAAYRDAAGERSVYTPQMVIHGDARVVGSHRTEVLHAIDAVAARPAPARLTIMREGEALAVKVDPMASASAPCVLWFVTYETPHAVDIKKGENAGKEIRYHNVVRSWMKMGVWDGAAPAMFAAPAPEAGTGVAVILQSGPAGPVVAAAKYGP